MFANLNHSAKHIQGKLYFKTNKKPYLQNTFDIHGISIHINSLTKKKKEKSVPQYWYEEKHFRDTKNNFIVIGLSNAFLYWKYDNRCNDGNENMTV